MNCAMSLISSNLELGFYGTHNQHKTCLSLQKPLANLGFIFACCGKKDSKVRHKGENALARL